MGNSVGQKSFTLIELLIVIGILATLATVVLIVINPTELMKQARDSTRLSDLGALNTSLGVAQTQGISFFGTSSMVYVSISDSTSTCANLGLPSLPSGWSYNCVPSSTLTKVDGTGWVPVNFTQMTIGAPFSNLPIDPINITTTQEYYTYVAGGSWKLTSLFESAKYAPKMNTDGGTDPALLEIGSDLSIQNTGRGVVGYWKFNEGSGTTASDSSGNNNTGTSYSSTTPTSLFTSSGCKTGSCASFDGVDDYVDVTNSDSLRPTQALTVGVWTKLNALSHQYLIGKTNPTATENGYGVALDPSGKFEFVLWGGSNSDAIREASGGTLAQTGVWYHIVAVADGTKIYIYLNGGLDRSADCTMATAGTTNLSVGKMGSGGYRSNGLIDDVRIYNRALSAAEISAIYNATK